MKKHGHGPRMPKFSSFMKTLTAWFVLSLCALFFWLRLGAVHEKYKTAMTITGLVRVRVRVRVRVAVTLTLNLTLTLILTLTR